MLSSCSFICPGLNVGAVCLGQTEITSPYYFLRVATTWNTEKRGAIRVTKLGRNVITNAK